MRGSAQNRLSDNASPNRGDMVTDYISFLTSVGHGGRSTSRRSMDGPSLNSEQNQASHNGRRADLGPILSMSNHVGAGPVLEEQQCESASALSLHISNQTGPLFRQSSSSISILQNSNINAGFGEQGATDCQIVARPHVFYSGLLENTQLSNGSSSSSDGRRSCKRKAVDGDYGQSSGSGTPNHHPHTEGSAWQSVPARLNTANCLAISSPSENTNDSSHSEQLPRCRLGVGGVSSESSHVLSAAGVLETTHGNSCLRINTSYAQDSSAHHNASPAGSSGGPSHASFSHPLMLGAAAAHDSVYTNVSAAGMDVGQFDVFLSRPLMLRPVPLVQDSVHTDVPAAGRDGRQSDVTVPRVLMLGPPAVADTASPPGPLVTGRAPAVSWHRQIWNRRNYNLQNRSSSSFAITGHRDAASSNISVNPSFVSASGMINSSQTPVNQCLTGGNTSSLEMVAASSRSGSISSVPPSSAPRLVPLQNSQEYSQRLSELVRRSLASSPSSDSGAAAQNSNTSPPHSGTHASLQENTISFGEQGNSMPHSGAAMLLDRHLDDAPRISNSLQALATARAERSRIFSEQLRSILDLIRRGEGLRFEDMIILDQSFGMGDITQDRHRDNMRLDIDNMSYEQLLALSERIGYVNTGLSEKTILDRLKKRKYTLATINQQQAVPCCICQEEYNDGENLGVLECGHQFHADCIKQWLTHKNLCPICKTTALAKHEKS